MKSGISSISNFSGVDPEEEFHRACKRETG
jgi:hypothetical protein